MIPFIGGGGGTFLVAESSSGGNVGFNTEDGNDYGELLRPAALPIGQAGFSITGIIYNSASARLTVTIDGDAVSYLAGKQITVNSVVYDFDSTVFGPTYTDRTTTRWVSSDPLTGGNMYEVKFS